jgi:dihydroneopterin aldolase
MEAGTDLVCIRGIRVVARHGVLPEEQERAQPFEIDLDIEVDLSEAARTDDLAATVDYGVLTERVVALVSSTRFGLLETLADAIAIEVLELVRVEAVTVAVRKLNPPIAADVASVGVRLRRTVH